MGNENWHDHQEHSRAMTRVTITILSRPFLDKENEAYLLWVQLDEKTTCLVGNILHWFNKCKISKVASLVDCILEKHLSHVKTKSTTVFGLPSSGSYRLRVCFSIPSVVTLISHDTSGSSRGVWDHSFWFTLHTPSSPWANIRKAMLHIFTT